MFSISDITLSILRILHQDFSYNTKLFAITPAAGESARGMGATGGVEGLIKKSAKQAIYSRNLKAMYMGIRGSLWMDSEFLLRSYLSLEISKIKSAAGKCADIKSLMLHEIVTDLALSLDLKWIFDSFIDFISSQKIQPGFETRNFAYLIAKFKNWKIDLAKVTIAAPFNKIGFLMIPSKKVCEETLYSIPTSNVLAISVLAAGYLNPSEAAGYIKSQPLLKGVAIAVSKEHHARETFKFF
jgi:hypothetical protein